MMNDMQLFAHTPTKIIPYSVCVNTMATHDTFKYANIQHIKHYCEIGCENYGNKWSCPPHSPCYLSYIKEYPVISICLLKINISELSYIKNNYLKVRAANSILKSRIDKALRASFPSLHHLSPGSCRQCRSCKKKSNLPCVHPDTISYSFESLGVNVQRLVHDVFNIDLLWYSAGNLPLYTCVVSGVLHSNEFNEDLFISTLDQLM